MTGDAHQQLVDPSDLTLRPAGSDDQHRLRALFAADRASLFAGLPAAMADDLVAMQWEAQQRGHRDAFPQATNWLVVSSGEVVGRALVDEGSDPVHVVDLLVAVDARRRGIATVVMALVRERAASTGRGVTLSVARDNAPAVALYRQLGLRVVREEEVRLTMTWDPPTASTSRQDAAVRSRAPCSTPTDTAEASHGSALTPPSGPS